MISVANVNRPQDKKVVLQYLGVIIRNYLSEH